MEADGSFARPLLDDEAEEMALRLALPRFDEGRTGTTVAVVDVDLGRRQGQDSETSRDADEAAEFIASTMLWNLWPRMLHDRRNRLVCSMRRDGFATKVPDPETLIELAPFIDAYRALHREGSYSVPIRKQDPKEIGRFALAKGMAPMRPDQLLSAAAPFEGRAHHCARMRQADLVVDYLSGEPASDEAIQYGAVFRASAEADRWFAESEPPTHDDWVLTGLRGTARGVVQLAGNFVRERLRVETQQQDASTTNDTPLGSLASRLSGLMAGAEGDSASASGARGNAGGGRRSSGGPRFVAGPSLVQEGESVVVLGTVRMPEWPSPKLVVVAPLIVLDNGVESPGGVTSHSPTVIGWRGVESGRSVPGSQLTVDRSDDRLWEVRVTPAVDAVVRLTLTVSDPIEATDL
jgi:hypothetical protein